MEDGEFDALARKVEQAATLIETLKREKEGLQSELRAAQERAGKLEKDLNRKAESVSEAGERIRALVARLETALA